MTQYLTTATIFDFRVSSANLGHLSGSIKKRLNKVQKAFVGANDCFDVQRASDDYVFSLKAPVVESKLIPLLSEFYDDLHNQGFKEHAAVPEEYRRPDLPKNLADIQKNAAYQQFKFDRHNSCSVQIDDYRIPVRFSSLMLVLENELKETDSMGDLSMNRFEETLEKVYGKYELANLLKCYVV